MHLMRSNNTKIPIDIWYNKIYLGNMIMHRVKVDNNVLHFFLVKDKIDRKVYTINVVTMHNRWLRKLNAKSPRRDLI